VGKAMGFDPLLVEQLLDGIDWRNPVYTFRPQRAG
jgi:error-prone DNA polymerase